MIEGPIGIKTKTNKCSIRTLIQQLLRIFICMEKFLDNKITLVIPFRLPNSLFINLRCFLDSIILIIGSSVVRHIETIRISA